MARTQRPVGQVVAAEFVQGPLNRVLEVEPV
jgi:hypothetical protein